MFGLANLHVLDLQNNKSKEQRIKNKDIRYQNINIYFVEKQEFTLLKKNNFVFKLIMNKTQHFKQKNIRFRRWSRVGYAVFVSLSAVVSIGCLSVSISNKSVIKSNNPVFVSENTLINNNAEEKEKASDLELYLEQKLNIIVNQQATDKVAILFIFNNINHNG